MQKFTAVLDAESTANLVAATRDPSAYVALLAADALSERANWDIAEALLPVFDELQSGGASGDPGCFIRTALAHMFGRIEFHLASHALIAGIRTVQLEAVAGVLNDVATQLRAACALALAELRDPAALREITPLLFDTGHNRIDSNFRISPLNPSLRAVAAKAIGRLGNPEGLAVLAIKLQFPEYERDSDVIAECMSAALELGGESALPLIVPYIEQRGHPLAPAAAIAIARHGIESGYALVEAAIGGSVGNDLKAIALSLASRRTPRTVEMLYALAMSGRDVEKVAFAEAVAVIRDRDAVPILNTLNESAQPPKVKQAVTAALAAIGA